MRGRRAEGRERGSALPLMPAAVLVVMVLAAIAVDFSIAFLGERELANATAAAANDAVAASVDENALRARDQLVLDPAKADAVARQALAARRTSFFDVRPEDVRVEVDGLRVRVSAEADVDYVFARALPHGPRHAHVQATSTATLRSGP